MNDQSPANYPPPQPQSPQWGPPPSAPAHTAGRPWYRRGWFVAPVALVVGIGIGSSGEADESKTTATTAVATAQAVVEESPAQAAPQTPAEATEPAQAAEPVKPAPAKPKVVYFGGDGTYVVGDDIRPGTYKTKGSEGFGCYWARLKDTDGDFGSIIANGNTEGPTTVTIKKSDGAFETRGCERWIRR